jgi:S1-C subfamily serine protease
MEDVRKPIIVILFITVIIIAGYSIFIHNRSKDKTTAEIAGEVSSSAVHIVTRSKIGLELGSGRGFIVSKDGMIVTSFHVIENAYYASIRLANGEVYDEVSVVNYDELRDIAVLKIKGFNPPAGISGNSNITSKIIKDTGTELAKFQDGLIKKKWLSGKSDMPPKNTFKTEKERRKLPYFGWGNVPISDWKRLKVVYFYKNSPAKDAGVQIGDEVAAFNGIKVEDKEKFYLTYKRLQPGEIVSVKLLRKGKEIERSIKLGERPKATNLYDAVGDELFQDKSVKLAVFADEINFIGNFGSAQKKDAEKVMAEAINNVRQGVEIFKNDKNFVLLDMDRVAAALHYFEISYGSILPAQIREGILRSLGVTHLVLLTQDRYAEDKHLTGKQERENRFKDEVTVKLIDLNNGELICRDSFLAETDQNGNRITPLDIVDFEDQEHIQRNKAISEEMMSITESGDRK